MNSPRNNSHTAAARVGGARSRGVAAIVAISVLCTGNIPAVSAGFEVLGLQPGIRAGGSMARLSLSTTPADVDNQWHPGLVVGATLAYNKLPIVGLELQVLYMEQGGELEGSIDFLGDMVEGQAKIKMAYLTIPLLANFKAPGVTMRPYAKLGPQVGFRISSKAELTPRSSAVIETDIKDETNSTDFSLYFAGGLEFPLTTISAYFEVGYGIGFVDLFKQDQDLGEPLNAKNNALTITAGLSY